MFAEDIDAQLLVRVVAFGFYVLVALVSVPPSADGRVLTVLIGLA